jgi:exosome complex exonuclease RRP6
MLEYARSDTHYLLYIYDSLKNALIDRSESRSASRAGSPIEEHSSSRRQPALVKQALARSQETSLKTYEKEMYDVAGGTGSNGWDTLARKWNKGALLAGGPGVGVGAMQRSVYRAVHKWREEVAREEDESTRYVERFSR